MLGKDEVMNRPQSSWHCVGRRQPYSPSLQPCLINPRYHIIIMASNSEDAPQLAQEIDLVGHREPKPECPCTQIIPSFKGLDAHPTLHSCHEACPV